MNPIQYDVFRRMNTSISMYAEDFRGRFASTSTMIARFNDVALWAIFFAMDMNHHCVDWPTTLIGGAYACRKFLSFRSPFFRKWIEWMLIPLILCGLMVSAPGITCIKVLSWCVIFQSLHLEFWTMTVFVIFGIYWHVFKFCKWAVKRARIADDPDWKCSICLGVEERFKCLQLDCSHVYHATCFSELALQSYAENRPLICCECRAPVKI